MPNNRVIGQNEASCIVSALNLVVLSTDEYFEKDVWLRRWLVNIYRNFTRDNNVCLLFVQATQKTAWSFQFL